jgi:very-short-patch-repair endonuclease
MKQDPRLVNNARELRRNQSPAEKNLWRALRGRRFGGYRFRRQHIVGCYIADFYCAVSALVLELDGESHLGAEDYDRVRQNYLEKQGLMVLRFWNTDVFEDLEPVLEVIWAQCQRRAVHPPRPLTWPSPHPQPLSPAGRGEKKNP